MSLLAAQRAFQAYLLNQSGDVMSRVAGPATDRMMVYHYAYRAQLGVALADSYEKTRVWLGETAFEAAVTAHIAGNPPSSWTLGHYGHGFATTLARLYPRDPEVRELAELDWALRQAFEARDEASLTAEQMANVDWSRVTLKLASSLHVNRATTNAAALWSAMAESQPLRVAEILPEPVTIRIWRDGLSPRFITMDAIEAEALSKVRKGAPFAEICAAMRNFAEVATLGDMLGSWLRDGLIVGLA